METPQRRSSSSSSLSQNPTVSSSSPLPPPSSSITRLWRPAAQRNLRNQWSKLASCRSEWATSSSAGRSHATSLVNAHLSQKYMPSMELGVVSDMPGIREKASSKLFKQQELHRTKLLSSYKLLVGVTAQMVAASKSMRSYAATNGSSSIIQFSHSSSVDNDDRGDGGDIPVFAFCSVSDFEQLADELVQMFISELIIKRLIVVELLSSISSEAPKEEQQWCWSNEIYLGEFEQLRVCNLYPSDETDQQPIRPRLTTMDLKSNFTNSIKQFETQPNSETLQVYLTTWLCEVNIDSQRVEEILTIVGEEMHVNLS